MKPVNQDSDFVRAQMGTSSAARSTAFKANGNTWLQNMQPIQQPAVPQQQPYSLPGEQTAIQTAEGVAKGVGSTASGLADIGKKITTGIGSLFGVKAAPDLDQQLQNASQPVGTAQTVGFGAEKVAEFFLPEGAESQIFDKGASLIDQLPEALGLEGKAATAITGTLKTALKSAITGASTATVTAAQTGGDEAQTKSAGLFGAIAGGAGQALESFGGGLLKSLQKSDFKLTPAAEAKAAQKVESAAQFMADNKILGSSSNKYSKLTNLTQSFEDTLQSSLPEKLQINKDAIASYVNQSLDSLKRTDPAVYNSASRDAKEALDLLGSKPGTSIDIGEALDGKRSYGKVAFKQSKVFDPKVTSIGSYAVEQGYQKAIEDVAGSTNVPIHIPPELQGYFGGNESVSLPEFNKVYSNAISAKNLTNIAQFRKDSGIVGRLFGISSGGALGQMIMPGLGGKVIGGAAGEIASTKLPGLARNLAERALSSGGIAPIATKVGLGINAATSNPQQQQ
jgi:hypothetical protein